MCVTRCGWGTPTKYYYFIFASQHDPLAPLSRETGTPHSAGEQWRGAGHPVARSRGLRSVASLTYTRTCYSTYTHT